MKKIFTTLLFLLFFANLQVFAQEKVLESSVTFNWLNTSKSQIESDINEVRDLLFNEGTVLKYDKAAFKEENIKEWKNKNYLEDFDAIRKGKKEDKDRYLCGFYWKNLMVAYGIQYKSKMEVVYYYDAMGNLRWLDKVSSAFPKYPYWSYQYDRTGKMVAAFYNLSGDDQYIFTPDKKFKGRWYKEYMYDENAKIRMKRSYW